MCCGESVQSATANYWMSFSMEQFCPVTRGVSHSTQKERTLFEDKKQVKDVRRNILSEIFKSYTRWHNLYKVYIK